MHGCWVPNCGRSFPRGRPKIYSQLTQCIVYMYCSSYLHLQLSRSVVRVTSLHHEVDTKIIRYWRRDELYTVMMYPTGYCTENFFLFLSSTLFFLCVCIVFVTLAVYDLHAGVSLCALWVSVVQSYRRHRTGERRSKAWHRCVVKNVVWPWR